MKNKNFTVINVRRLLSHKIEGKKKKMFDTLPVVLNNYEFIKPIGQGTFSTVFMVESIKYKQTFAAKVSVTDSSVLSENGTIVDSEFNALQALDHPHIIRIFDKFFIQDFFVLILEYFPGGTVQDMLSDGATFSDRNIQVLAFGLLDGLSLCHEKALAHRDIKPSNIFIDGYGRWKLADFNLCSILKSKKNLVENPTGSLPYVSPEILAGNAYDPFKADIWALGVTFYQLTVGKLPWTEEEILSNTRRPLRFPANYNPLLKQIIINMLNEKAELRPSAAQLLRMPFFKEGKAYQMNMRIPGQVLTRSTTSGFSGLIGLSQTNYKTPSSIRMSAARVLLRKTTCSSRPRGNSFASRVKFTQDQ